MTQQMQLPDYLRNRSVPNLTDRAMVGLGAMLPPHISIRGNRFTLVDSSGHQEPVQQVFLDVAIADMSEVVCKTYYDAEWEPGANDPPACFSANGVAPSSEAINPQARTCAECPQNVRGSAVSKLSGAAIKACRDEKWLAVIVVGYPKDMIFRLVLTPGSFTNWRGYAERFRGQEVKINDVICRLNFEQGKNGVLTFEVANWLDQRTAELQTKALASKATDVYVGRNDQPRLSGPVAQQPAQAMIQPTVEGGLAIPPATGPFAQTQPAQGFTVPSSAAAPAAGFPSTSTAPPQTQTAPPATAASPSDGKRRRRTKAEMEAVRAGQPAMQAQPAAAPIPVQPQGFQPAPFRPAAASAESAAAPIANGPAPQFGMSSGVAPNPELAATLNSIMGK